MITCIELENWKTHHKTRMEFGPGTNVLIGVLGSGKSSVMDAICFALFGTFPALQGREVALKEVLTRKPFKAESARIKLEFEYEKKQYLVERVIKANGTNEAKVWENQRLLAGPKVQEVNARIQSILEMNYDLFARAVYAEQNQVDYFLKLNPGQRKAKFDELLGLDKYEEVRSNSVNVQNRLKKEAEEKRKWLEDLSTQFNVNDLTELHERLARKEKQALDVQSDLERLKAEDAKLQETLRALNAIEKEYSRLKEELHRTRGRRESLEDRVKELEKNLAGHPFQTEQEARHAQEELERQRKELEDQRLKAQKTALEAQSFRERAHDARKQAGVRAKSMPAQSKEELQEQKNLIAKALEELEKERSTGKQEFQHASKEESALNEKIEIMKERVEKLDETGPQCPVCSKPLKEKEIHELKKTAEKELEDARHGHQAIKKRARALEEKLENLEATLERKKGEQLDLKAAGRTLEEVEELKKRVLDCEEKAQNLEARAKEWNENAWKGTREKIEKDLERIRMAVELIGIQKEAGQCGQRVHELAFKLEALAYNEEEATRTRAHAARMNAQHAALEKELLGLKENARETRQALERLQKIQAQLEGEGQRIQRLENSAQKMGFFVNALKETQIQLRETMLTAINQGMENLWPHLYPYEDYTCARIQIEEGNYEVKVRERSGEWVRAEGILSGGERSAVALTLRMAIALVLTRQLSWIILDEPTHNLDVKTVDRLSRLMKTHLPGLVEQIFIITHNPEVEKAATSTLYVLQRDKNVDGLTKPEKREIPIEMREME
ncbi:MAG: AAA family ATPase [Candidatus Diapherotrites archaeon]|nr:AAA family ATPase [Candidatus Diapherotrites archaeon]